MSWCWPSLPQVTGDTFLEVLLIAGPVFQEWYWPLFFGLIFVGPPLLLAVLLVDGVATWAARRAGRRRSKIERAGVAAAVVALAIGGLWLWSVLESGG